MAGAGVARARRWETPRTPTKDHCCISSLIILIILDGLGLIPSKTHWLQWFHKDQELRMMMEFTPFYTWPETLLLVDAHQSSKNLSPACGASACRPRSCSTANQTCRLKTQDTSRWSIVSSVWSQSGHAAGWHSPFLASLSAIQHFLCAIVHMKNLHLPGASFAKFSPKG